MPRKSRRTVDDGAAHASDGAAGRRGARASSQIEQDESAAGVPPFTNRGEP